MEQTVDLSIVGLIVAVGGMFITSNYNRLLGGIVVIAGIALIIKDKMRMKK